MGDAETGNIDNLDRFLLDLVKLPVGEVKVVLAVKLLAQVLDGDLGDNEFDAWAAVLGALRDHPGITTDQTLPGGLAAGDEDHLQLQAFAFRSRQFLSAESLENAVARSLNVSLHCALVPVNFTGCLTKCCLDLFHMA